jgi:23S rRNA (uracil1939-C5)-methyltransferase
MRVTIEKLVYGGDGLARTSEGVVFVPRTAPGDVVEVEIRERKKDYAMARLIAILEQSGDRQPPFCPNYESAGCCHWQHIRYERQLDFKESILRETLWRAGRIEWNEPVGRISGPDRADRIRATFHTRNGRLGFMRERTREVTPILECSALAPALNAFIPEANAMLASSPELAGVTEVRAVAGSDGAVAANFDAGPGGMRRRRGPASDDVLPRAEINGLQFELHPDAFFQSNRFLAGPLIDAILQETGDPAGLACDLYCGTGFFSIPLARAGWQVSGVDSNRTAIRQAQRNAQLNGISNVEFVEKDLDEVIAGKDWRPELVLVDPPRSGCGVSNAERVASWKAPLLIYVSCNPSTFAREAAVFLKSGYRLNRLTLVDQFPNTYHIEMVARFGLGSQSGNN